MVKEKNGANHKTYNKQAPKKATKPVSRVPRELEDVVKIVKYNANIKRHTALNIINRFVEDGFIDNAKGAFVEFNWQKYSVRHNGVTKEYPYDKTFIEALVKAHENIANDSSKCIKTFIEFAKID